MPSTTDNALGLSQLQSPLAPPPQYPEATSQRDLKVVDNSDYSHSPWLLRRTSIHIESTPNEAWQDDKPSHRDIAPSIKSNDEKKALRNLLTKIGNRTAEDQSEDGRTDRDVGQAHNSADFGTRVFIEAVQPQKVQMRKRHEMKGLEQAASMKRWPGNGLPAEPWGKLAKVHPLSILLLTTGVAKMSRTLNFGTLLEIRWYIMATNVRKLHSESSHQFWKERDRKS